MSSGKVLSRPTRLGHANLFVANVDQSAKFYNDVAGVELVRREPTIAMAFHSNGASHHDIGLVEVQPGERLGIDGFVQVSSNRATKAGLNHLGWEMHSEVDLIDAFRRVKSNGIAILNSADHQISHAAYIVDPNGNYHELYADAMQDWRSIFSLEHEELVSQAWDWEAVKNAMGPIPMDPNDRRRVDTALFHPTRISHATLVVEKYLGTLTFLTDLCGLDLISDQDGVAMLKGSNSILDLIIVDARHGMKPGLHSIAFQVESEEDFLDSLKALTSKSLDVRMTFDMDNKRSVVLSDPDGVGVELSYRVPGTLPNIPKPSSADSSWVYRA